MRSSTRGTHREPSEFTLLKSSPHKFIRHNKPLPMYGKDFRPGKGMVPVTVFIGSHDAIGATKANRLCGFNSQVCIKPSDDPAAFNWSFLRGLPVIVQAPSGFPKRCAESLVIELAKAGATDIAGITDRGEILVVYRWTLEAGS